LRVCLTKARATRGVVVTRVCNLWTVEYAGGERRNHKPGDLTVLPRDGAFVASCAPLLSEGAKRRRALLAQLTSGDAVVLEPPKKRARPAAKSETERNECPVCLEELSETADVVRLDCTLEFCGECFAELAALASSRQTRAGTVVQCPTCRQDARATTESGT